MQGSEQAKHRRKKYITKHGEPEEKACPTCGRLIDPVGKAAGWDYSNCLYCAGEQRKRRPAARRTQPSANGPVRVGTVLNLIHDSRPQPAICEYCNKPVEPVEMPDGRFFRAWQHDECMRAEAKAQERREARSEAGFLLMQANLPANAPSYSWRYAREHVDPAALKRVEGWEYGPTGLYLHGDVGCGKSGLALLRLTKEISKGTPGMWLNVSAWLQRLREDVAQHQQQGEGLTLRAQRVGLLVLDDLGAEQPTEFGRKAITRVIGARAEHRLPIIFTANYDTRDLHLQMQGQDQNSMAASRIVDRIAEATVGGVVEVRGESLRLRRAQGEAV